MPTPSGMMADLAGRLDVAGRRIVVLAGPGDRRDEDLVAIAKAVAGRFDHYICRRDDNLRDRAPDEVPRIQAQALRAAGVPESAISIIPDEQEAIEAALAHGRSRRSVVDICRCPGALLEADHQIQGEQHRRAESAPRLRTRKGPRSNGPQRSRPRTMSAPHPAAPAFNLEGLIRDERGIRMAPESED